MRELLQDEIDRCTQLVEKVKESEKPWGNTVVSIMMMDIQSAERAIEENHDTAMFRSYRALRLYNLPYLTPTVYRNPNLS